MTKRELIEALKDYDDDAEVVLDHPDGGASRNLEEVYIRSDTEPVIHLWPGDSSR
jgi:hypothetical protein